MNKLCRLCRKFLRESPERTFRVAGQNQKELRLMLRNPRHNLALLGCLAAICLLVNPVLAQPPHNVLPTPRATLGPLTVPQAELGLNDLIAMSLDNNPKLQQVGSDIVAAQGQELQAGLYPNPVLSGSFDELGDRTGTGGINTFPYITQEIVTAGKLKLSRAVAAKNVDIATLDLLRQRYWLLTEIRKGYFKVLAIQQEIEILEELHRFAYQSFQIAKKRKDAQQIAELEFLQFRVESNRWAAKLEGAEWRRVAAWQQLTATMGTPDLPPKLLKGSLKASLPDYDFATVRDLILDTHPEAQAAEVLVAKAQLAMRRAEVEKYPNVTIGAGYTRQNQNKSDDWSFQVGIPIPVYDRNQGNILVAQAELSKAMQGINFTRNDLINRLAEAFGRYDSTRKQLSRYSIGILNDSGKALQLSMLGYQEKEFDYLRVLQTQRALAETRLEYLQILSEAWQAAGDIAGLLLQDQWPGPEWYR
jgi:cobalt-zinc-cadmium efflux system outer membrane protein